MYLQRSHQQHIDVPFVKDICFSGLCVRVCFSVCVACITVVFCDTILFVTLGQEGRHPEGEGGFRKRLVRWLVRWWLQKEGKGRKERHW